ncbi:hypothetical protein HMPREF1204_02449 [Bacteroides fragilis HMW 615]|nr:hypothetical protein HMPREF1204_02449 [Bacteroides fragilis HMW 615]
MRQIISYIYVSLNERFLKHQLIESVRFHLK